MGTLYYTYDANGNLTSLLSGTTGGVTNTYQYDGLSRLTNVIDNRLTGTKNTAYTFDLAGNLKTLAYPNAVTNLYQYDSLNRLTNLTWKLATTTLGTFYYQLGQAGNRTNLTETVNGASRGYAWQYDPLYRLTNETVSTTAPTGTVGYSYDAVGNRTNRTSTLSGIVATNNVYDANDWLTNTVAAAPYYDANGNTRTNGTTYFGYDWANRLTSQTNVSAVVNIVYDADGNRVKKVASTTTIYLVAMVNPTGWPQVVEESTVTGGVTNLAKVYTHGLALISQRLPGTSTNVYGFDGHGSTRFLLNPAGAITDTDMYDAYGSLVNSTGTTANNYLYAGEQNDPDLGLFYLRARYYNPGAGRFWTMDSDEGDQTDSLSLHKYLYCEANPLNMVDRSGHDGDLETLEVVESAEADFDTAALPGLRAGPAFALNKIEQGIATAAITYLLAEDSDPRFNDAFVVRVRAFGPETLKNNSSAVPGHYRFDWLFLCKCRTGQDNLGVGEGLEDSHNQKLQLAQ